MINLYRYTANTILFQLLCLLAIILFVLITLSHYFNWASLVDVKFSLFVTLWSVGGIAIVDFLLLWRKPSLNLFRNCPSSVAVGVFHHLDYIIKNDSKYVYHYCFYDDLPIEFRLDDAVVRGSIHPKKMIKHRSRFKSLKRGNFDLKTIYVSLYSPLRLWLRHDRIVATSNIKVFPDFSLIKRYILFATQAHVGLMGIKQQRRRGQGSNFHQLREYQQGDAMRQIDWSATARHNKLISKEYQDEKQQEIMILLDCGKRMRSKDAELSHFDHALNAAMLLSYVALRQGDAVGLMTMGGVKRLIPIKGGIQHINNFHNGTYDLQPSLAATDFIDAAMDFETRQKKRCLIVMITNLHEEDYSDILPAISRLSKKRLVMLANVKELVLEDMMRKTVGDIASALEYCGASIYMHAQQRLIHRLNQMGVITVDTYPNNLLENIVSQYFAIKRSQRL